LFNYESIQKATESVATSSTTNFNIGSGIQNYMQSLTKTTSSSLEKDFSLLESTGTRSPRLEKLYQALLSLKPTSTVCEQTFSTASSIKTKVRNRMKSSRLQILVWLKYHFKEKSK
jgi:hypothetical protein